MMRLCIFFLLIFTILHLHQVSAQTCTRAPEHFKIRCANESVSVGNQLQCRCIEHCRPFTLKCLADGTFEKLDFISYCVGTQYTTEVELKSGRKVKLSFKKTFFEEQCKEGNIRADMSEVCDRVHGMKIDSLPLCDHTCPTPPAGLECPQNVYRSREGNIRCLCKGNCLYFGTRCDRGNIPPDLSKCNEAYTIEDYYLGDGFDLQETVNATFTPNSLGDASPEVHCPTGVKTLVPGKITCSNGNAIVAIPPTCVKTCKRIPEHFKIRCNADEVVSVGGTLKCRCLDNCRPFELKCMEDGTYERMDYISYCFANQYTTEIALRTGRKINLSFKQKYFEEQCENGIIRADMFNVCDRNGFKEEHLPLCDNTCTNPPSELACTKNVFRSSNGNIRCLCRQNCVYVETHCEGDISSELARCREGYAIGDFYLGDGFELQSTVNATYTPNLFGTASPEIHCPSGEKTITPGSMTCSNGIAVVSTPPSCESNTSLYVIIISLIVAVIVVVLIIIIFIICRKKRRNNRTTAAKFVSSEVIYDEIDLNRVFPNVPPALPPRPPEGLSYLGVLASQNAASDPWRPGNRPAGNRNTMLQDDVDQDGYLVSAPDMIVGDRAGRRVTKPAPKPLPAVPRNSVMAQNDIGREGYVTMSAAKKFVGGTVTGTDPQPFIKPSQNVLHDEEGGYANSVSNIR